MAAKTVLITGSSEGGIGHALCLEFQKRGLTVFATARSVNKMAGLGDLPNIHLITLDVTSPESVAAAAKEVDIRTGGKLDYLINNAGNLYSMPTLDVNIEDAKAMFEVNYWGVLRMTQAFSDMLIAAKGTIVNVGSGAGVCHTPFQSMYNSSKAAVNMLSETARLELAPLGVKVITLVLGAVESHMSKKRTEEIPATSYYRPIKQHLDADPGWNAIPVEKFSRTMVDDVLGGKTGKIYAGGDSLAVKWLIPYIPAWLFDYLMIVHGKGLGKMPRL
ncbi:NAD(P)-binding protein [Corynespora cassiicola Philippines]|uniref:NAD(P)-binding protein n=1 Tax=Corynespora cassiicola Philippines TaxID=1448308 RepID=A0A2T2NFZ2_CORCC|nr:NAD(P)-binding protein [Corynespora cassiicola Philippines]